MKFHEPVHTALFLLLLVGVLYLAPYLEIFLDTPEKEVRLAEVIPEIDSLQVDYKIEEIEEIEGIEEIDVIEEIKATDGFDIHCDGPFTGNASAKKKLFRFFEKLSGLEDTSEELHVFHYGDSQIEGDRITGRIRSSWQKTWGGSGPGLIPASQPIPSLALRQSHKGNIKRYTQFGREDSTLKHNCYGGMAAFTRIYDSMSLLVKPHPVGFRKNKVWHEAEILIGGAPEGGKLTVYGEETDSVTIEIAPSQAGSHSSVTVKLDGVKEDLNFDFTGREIDVTGIKLGSGYGLVVHNIPMRGSSGTLFKKLNKDHYKKYMQHWNVGLVILQFGGNTAPYILDELAAMRYGKRFRKQLTYLKSILPDAAFLVIGPSDMGISSDSTALTYPMLGAIRNEMEKVTVMEGELFWDMFEAMGGEGTMEVWAEEEPRLASPDLVHFTPKGAKVIGDLLDEAFRSEFRIWEKLVKKE